MTEPKKGKFVNGKTLTIVLAVACLLFGGFIDRVVLRDAVSADEIAGLRKDQLRLLCLDEIKKAIDRLELRIVPVIENAVQKAIESHGKKDGG